MHRFILSLSTLVFVFFLAGCAANGDNIKANVYKADQVNTAQEAKVVTILAIMPAKIEVNNSEQKRGAEVVGGILGAVAGGLLGNKLSSNDTRTGGTALGVVGGGVAGAAAGSLVSDKVLVDGVSITYEYDGKTLNSAQVGKSCEYKPGKAIIIATSPAETRIQPNDSCPENTAN